MGQKQSEEVVISKEQRNNIFASGSALTQIDDSLKRNKIMILSHDVIQFINRDAKILAKFTGNNEINTVLSFWNKQVSNKNNELVSNIEDFIVTNERLLNLYKSEAFKIGIYFYVDS